MRTLLGTLWGRLVRCFLAGLFAILPLVVTVGIVVWVASFVERLIGPSAFLGRRLQSLGVRLAGEGQETVAYILGWLIVLLLIFGLGILMELGAQRLFQQLLERLLQRIPLISSVYGTSKQVVGMLDHKRGDTDLTGMRPVLCEFGAPPGAAVLALLAAPDDLQVAGNTYRMVIIPTAPVPFGGALLLVPSSSVKPLNLSVEGLMNIYVSMGVSAQRFLPTVAK